MFHILVVEDNPNARKLMEAVLKQNGYEPLTVLKRWMFWIISMWI